MAHFYGEMQGSRGPTSRMGTPQSGFEAHVRGWHVGVKVHCFVDDDGRDVINVWQTGGSNNPGRVRLIATLEHDRPA